MRVASVRESPGMGSRKWEGCDYGGQVLCCFTKHSQDEADGFARNEQRKVRC